MSRELSKTYCKTCLNLKITSKITVVSDFIGHRRLNYILGFYSNILINIFISLFGLVFCVLRFIVINTFYVSFNSTALKRSKLVLGPMPEFFFTISLTLSGTDAGGAWKSSNSLGTASSTS
jgi:hypothetical protein